MMLCDYFINVYRDKHLLLYGLVILLCGCNCEYNARNMVNQY